MYFSLYPTPPPPSACPVPPFVSCLGSGRVLWPLSTSNQFLCILMESLWWHLVLKQVFQPRTLVGYFGRHLLRKKNNIQLFRERLSYKRVKANATMSKVIMGNGSFTVAWVNLKVFQRGGGKQHKYVFVFSRSLLLNRLETQSSKANLLLPIMPIGIVEYPFTLLWDNLCRNSCIWVIDKC